MVWGTIAAVTGASLIDGIFGNEAADEISDANAASIALQRDIFDQIYDDQQIYRDAAEPAMERLMALMGLEAAPPDPFADRPPGAGAGGQSPGQGGEPGFDARAYLLANPSLGRVWDSMSPENAAYVEKRFGTDDDAILRWATEHYNTRHKRPDENFKLYPDGYYDTPGDSGAGTGVGGGGQVGSTAVPQTLFGVEVTDPSTQILLSAPGARESLEFGYERAMDAGQAALAAAGIKGPRAAKQLAEEAQTLGTASLYGLYNDEINRLNAMLGLNQTSSQVTANAGQNFGSAAQRANEQIGQANAYGQNAIGQSVGGLIGGVYQGGQTAGWWA